MLLKANLIHFFLYLSVVNAADSIINTRAGNGSIF